MTTDYQKLTLFDVAAVFMVVIGLGLVSFQIYTALPESAQAKLSASVQILDVADAAREVVAVQSMVIDFAMTGSEDFYKEFYVASGEVLAPVADQTRSALASLRSAGSTVAQLADYMAAVKTYNQQYDIARSGVEDTFGGRVMGAYFEKLELAGQ